MSSNERYNDDGDTDAAPAPAPAPAALLDGRFRFRLVFPERAEGGSCTAGEGGGGGVMNAASVAETKVRDWTEQMEMASLFSSFRSL